MTHSESLALHDFDDADHDNEFVDDFEDRRRRQRKDLAALRRRAEQRMERKRLREQLGYYDTDDLGDLDI